ncbi:Hypothetical protein ABZS17H1_04021 [Kosakonia cowanii]
MQSRYVVFGSANQCWRGFAAKMRVLSIKSAVKQKKRKFAFRGLQQE